MNYEKIVFKLIDLFSSNRFKFKDTDQTRNIYENVYVPIFQKLFSYFRNYKENKELIEALKDCRKILLNSFSQINPSYIKQINKIIDNDGEFVSYVPPTNIAKITYNLKTKKRKHTFDEKMRRSSFYWFVHEFIKDYTKIQKALGIYSMNLNQRMTLDQITLENTNIAVIPTLVALLVSIVLVLFTQFTF